MAPIDLFAQALRLHAGGLVTPEKRRMDSGADGWTIAAFHVATSDDVHGDHWEVHPIAEEAVCVLSGAARVVLRGDPADGSDGESGATHVTLAAGQAYLVPRGRWHRLEIDGPTDLMSISQRSETRLEKRR